jgi:hypothetical protein
MYRHGTVKRRPTLGTYPALSLAEAREKAGSAHHMLQYESADPAAVKKAERTADLHRMPPTISSATRSGEAILAQGYADPG